MRKVIEILLRLLSIDIKTKNAVSLLFALTVMLWYLVDSKGRVFYEREQSSSLVTLFVLSIVFIMLFDGMWLTSTCVAWIYGWGKTLQTRHRENRKQEENLRDTVEGLTPWQFEFIKRFVREHKRQIAYYEIGGYQSVWGFEMEVLVKKGIVKKYAAIYEIDTEYYKFLERLLSDAEKI